MNIENYFTSVTKEFESLKNRVRDFINDAHWQTDGEWKESVLRSILKRHMPDTYKIGRGFVITKEEISSQIDILIYDSSKPILYQDGDLVFITPDSAKVIIEVKTKLTYQTFENTLDKLCSNIALIIKNGGRKCSSGLFCYEDDLNDYNRVLEILYNKVEEKQKRIIKYISIGNSNFIRYWAKDPLNQRRSHEKWHLYLLENKAPAYFINNIIEDVCESSVMLNQEMWYPRDGKEPNKTNEKNFKNV
jgi:hypothetical protein